MSIVPTKIRSHHTTLHPYPAQAVKCLFSNSYSLMGRLKQEAEGPPSLTWLVQKQLTSIPATRPAQLALCTHISTVLLMWDLFCIIEYMQLWLGIYMTCQAEKIIVWLRYSSLKPTCIYKLKRIENTAISF